MNAVREKWTDERLDDLNDRVSEGFNRIDGELRVLRGEMNSRFESMEERFDARFDALHKLLLRAAGGAIAVLVTTGAALVATQL
ncbi:MAG TPA: hypothetical protein VG898_11665 [Solirubrobacterales bacterium]|nr:hypothetical protein [Solirubrobacterales bacterium]